ncbi:MAG: YfhO family protein [Blastocatellia bacterium]|nr:YfhO family protein [Blastocatellia bacterium]
MSTTSDNRSGWGSRVGAGVGLLSIPILYFYPAVRGAVMLAPGDGWTQIIGIRVLIGQMLREGQLPLWNPYIFSGMPLLASIQPGALYPPTWLFAVLSPQPAMNWMVITTFHLALFGTYLYARRIGADRVGALAGGIAFAFGGYMVAHVGHTNRIAAAAWLPWILLAIEALSQRLRWRWVALGAGFIAMQLLAGEPQMSLYTGMVAGAYAVFSLTLREEGERFRRQLFGFGAMAVCGALLSAAQLLPDRELLRRGEREAISYDYFSLFSFPPRQLPQLIFPYFFGGAAKAPYEVTYWGQWNPTETAGYVGMAAMMLGLVAVFAQVARGKRDRRVWFWAGCALVSLLLAFGSNLPFGIHRALHGVPVYKLFRASGRHLFEFDFALAVLAAIGATILAQQGERASRAIRASALAMTGIVVGTAILYRYFPERLAMDLPVTPGAASFANWEVRLPVLFFVLSLGAVGLYWRSRMGSGWLRGGASALLILISLADLGAFGFFYEWNNVPGDLAARMGDPPTVRWIKEREPDLNAFRIVSHSPEPMGSNYEALDFPNVSIARGLQSVNGYDPLVLGRYAAFAGNMNLDGIIRDGGAFDALDQSFNLLNAKYLLRERAERSGPRELVEREGIRFGAIPMNLVLSKGKSASLRGRGMATELGVISSLERSPAVPNGAVVADLVIRTVDGRLIERQIVAGRDASEWAYDRPDVRAAIRHDRARVIESFADAGFQGHRYLARFPFERAEIAAVEIRYRHSEASISLAAVSLYDGVTAQSQPLTEVELAPSRWRMVATLGEVEIYENLKRMPRAWFVRRAAVMPGLEVLETVRNGRLPDGAAFDPAETVLFEKEDFGRREVVLPPIAEPANAEVKVARYQPQRIEIETRNEQPGFLVLSEIYYRGWDAWIDGRRVPVEKVNYVLRGVAVPAGAHRIEFVFRSPSFRNGAAYSVLGLALLLVGGLLRKMRKSRKRINPNSKPDAR